MPNHRSATAPLDALHGGLVVSSQAMDARSPLQDSHLLSLLAQTAALGGAAGFRVDGAEVVADLRPTTSLPIIGIRKDRSSGTDTYITPTAGQALGLVGAGADIVAAQATAGTRPAESFAEIAAAVHDAGALIMADVSTAAEGVRAARDGADIVATTMAGYTPASAGTLRPALDMVRTLVDQIDVPIIVEGGIWTPEHVGAAFDAGAWAVVVGSAVTAPDIITARLNAAAPAGVTTATDPATAK